MPPRKRTSCNPRKPRLVFLESPHQGPVHEYGPAPPKAENPKYVPTKPLDPNTSAAWVSPQFDHTVELHFPARRRLRHTSNNNTLQSRTGDASRSQLRAPGRKLSVCKFPSLSFTSQETAGITQTPSLRARRRPKPNIVLPSVSESPSPPPSRERSCSRSLSPPNVQTPGTSPNVNTLLSPGTAGIRTPVTRRRAEQCEVPDTPLVNGQDQVLAEDTPEHEYGVRITWRRRQELMKYLKSRGRLKSSQILVKP